MDDPKAIIYSLFKRGVVRGGALFPFILYFICLQTQTTVFEKKIFRVDFDFDNATNEMKITTLTQE